jgi:hypothetical protein
MPTTDGIYRLLRDDQLYCRVILSGLVLSNPIHPRTVESNRGKILQATRRDKRPLDSALLPILVLVVLKLLPWSYE